MVPFLVGVAAFTAIDFTRFEGTAQNRTALLLVFAIAIAVTSIPVISRIMLDLGCSRPALPGSCSRSQ